MGTSASPAFVPPSPGAWELERTHATRPVSRFMAAVFAAPMVRGFSEATRAYGALLDHIELAMINGLMYSAARPVGAPKGAKGPPPRPVFWLLTRLHPEIRRRNRRADEVFAERYWRKELQWWDAEVKPEISRDAAALLADDVPTLSDADLTRHVQRATAFMEKTIYFHHRMNCCALLPPADFITHVMRWTGEKAEVVLLALRGQSPMSAGANSELEALRRAIEDDSEAKSVLSAGRSAADVLTALEARPGVAAPLRTYLNTVGWRVMGGYDVADRHGREHPELLVKIIRAAVSKGEPTPGSGVGPAIAALRAKVPSEHHAQFDALLEEAQITYRVRDERNFCSDALGIGLARRAILAVGVRLKARGRVHDALHLVDASPEELAALLDGGGPSADELVARVKFRETTSLDSAPQHLGVPPSPPPPGEWLSGGAGRMQSAINVALGLMFSVPAKQEGTGKQLKGFGVSPGVFEGPARVIVDISELPTVRDGEVLVTPSTGPTFNVVLPLLKGLVTERGGALSHAAIVAREYGIPGVVGCRDATSRVTTGTRVRVDGTKGELWILD